jgi:hypothetical protein
VNLMHGEKRAARIRTVQARTTVDWNKQHASNLLRIAH